MKLMILACFLFVSVSVASADDFTPDNFSSASTGYESQSGCKTETEYQKVVTTHYVRHRPLTKEEQCFLDTFPEYVGAFAIRKAVYEMLVTNPPVVHVNPKGYDCTGKDQARNALHYTTLYQAWLGPHVVKIPIMPKPSCPPFQEAGPAPKQPGLCLEPVPVAKRPEKPEKPIPCPVPCPTSIKYAPRVGRERLPERQIFAPVPETGVSVWWQNQPREKIPEPCPPGQAPAPPPPSEAFPDLPPGVKSPTYPHYPGDILKPGEPEPPWAPPPPNKAYY